jgi:acyl homoserine lactone synthase
MDVIVVNNQTARYVPELLNDMFKLRARVFRDRLRWDVAVHEGEEHDQFDSLDPHYLLAVAPGGALAGSARLLPATGPTMLQEVFPMLLAKGRLEATRTTVESSRFCVDTDIATGNTKFLHEATLSLFACIIEWSIAHGYHDIVTATDLRFERLLRYSGWPMCRLGEPHLIGNVKSIAGRLEASPQFLQLMTSASYRMKDLADDACGPDDTRRPPRRSRDARTSRNTGTCTCPNEIG